jgi:hypothetical protein
MESDTPQRRQRPERADLRLRKVELMGRYSSLDNVAAFQRILAGRGRHRPPARTTRSVRQIHHRLMPADLDRLLELYRDGAKINDLATQFQISHHRHDTR